MNQRQKEIFDSYLKSSDYCLGCVYERWSSKKYEAWNHCLEVMREKDGYDIRILSANRYMFTVGFRFKRDNKTYLMHITKYQEEEFEVRE